MGEQPPPIPVQYQVTYQKRRTSHVLHLLLSIITFGLWIPIWIIIAIVHATSPGQQQVTGVYGTQYPGHPGPAGVPQRPVSRQDLVDPAGIHKLTPAQEHIRAVGAIGGALILVAALGGSVGGAITLAVITVGALGFLWYRQRPIRVPPAVEPPQGS